MLNHLTDNDDDDHPKQVHGKLHPVLLHAFLRVELGYRCNVMFFSQQPQETRKKTHTHTQKRTKKQAGEGKAGKQIADCRYGKHILRSHVVIAVPGTKQETKIRAAIKLSNCPGTK